MANCFSQLGVVAASRVLNLTLEGKVILGVFRCAAQLFVLGYCLLVPLFSSQSSWAILGYISFMILVASAEASARPTHSYAKMYMHVLASIGAALCGTLGICLLVIVKSEPRLNAHTAIPLGGMLLGNSITSVTLSLDRFLAEMSAHGAARVELLLCLGASRSEAALPATRAAAKAGLTPSLNSMSVVGLVAIPGMMTGQILGGQPPAEAAKYQIVITYLICCCAAASICVINFFALRSVIGADHRFNSGALKKRTGPRRDLLQRTVQSAWLLCKTLCGAVSSLLCGRRTDRYDAVNTDEETPLGQAAERATGVREGSPIGVATGVLSIDGLSRSSSATSQAVLETCAELGRRGALNGGERGALCLSQVCAHGGGNLCVREVTLGLLAGECLCVTGSSGVGKSRLLRRIAGIDAPHAADRGVVMADGQTISNAGMPDWRARVMYVPQDCPALSGSPRAQLRQAMKFGAHRRRERRAGIAGGSVDSESLSAQTALAGRLRLTPEHLDCEWSTLSGGERHRALLWVALCLEPRVLLLDEPTAALDHETARAVEGVLVQSRVTLVWVTHDVAQAKRVAHLQLHLQVQSRNQTGIFNITTPL